MPPSATWPASLPLQLLLLSIATQMAAASPVSAPEIASKSGKTTTGSGGGGSSSSIIIGVQPQQHQHQHQQHQQHQTLKSSPQDAHLNSLAVYAGNYDFLSNANTQPSFKPSYKMPDMETNFTPLHSGGGPGSSSTGAGPSPAAMGAPTPVIMQYMPHTMHEGGIQYLQLIPTRPLIVPISPYLTGGANAGQSAATAATVGSYHAPLAASNTHADYGPRSPTVLTPLPGNNQHQQPVASALVELPPTNLPYGLHTYANSIQPYRSTYRINREIKEKHLPGPVNLNVLGLNMNEYLPGPHDTPAHPTYFRGRP